MQKDTLHLRFSFQIWSSLCIQIVSITSRGIYLDSGGFQYQAFRTYIFESSRSQPFRDLGCEICNDKNLKMYFSLFATLKAGKTVAAFFSYNFTLIFVSLQESNPPKFNLFGSQKMVQSKAEIFRRAPYLIGVAGGTASGKTTVCQNIIDHLGDTNKRVVIISQDSFYRNLSDDELTLAKAGDFNFDHPSLFYYFGFESSLRIPIFQMPLMMFSFTKFSAILRKDTQLKSHTMILSTMHGTFLKILTIFGWYINFYNF